MQGDTNCDTVEELTCFLALFILKTKETNGLSQQAINSITTNTSELVELGFVTYLFVLLVYVK